ncbi:nucleotidyltransferase [Bacillus sp. TS-2]|nr:nucleotidyltransferase [Bacillus sp. TS-2]
MSHSVGLIVEYNPFHNGHALHLQTSKQLSNANMVVAVMSGFFLQRGEPALLPKWERARMALMAGADLVIELPYYYSVQKAELFAEGAIKVLSELGVHSVSFGSENGDIQDFKELISFIQQHQSEWDELVRMEMKSGKSYPKATSNAFEAINSNQKPGLSLSQPNNILGYHYLRAIEKFAPTMEAYTLKRTSAQYHDEQIPIESIASATSIRKALFEEKNLHLIKHVVPRSTWDILSQYEQAFNSFQQWESYFPYLQYQLITSSHEQLREIYECEEGLEFRLKEAIKQSTSFSDFMNRIKTKRYTWNRLQRLLTHILTQTTKKEVDQLLALETLPYLRLLGMSSRGREYLRKNKKEINTPIISRFANAFGPLKELDERVAATYATGLPNITRVNEMSSEYKQIPIQL